MEFNSYMQKREHIEIRELDVVIASYVHQDLIPLHSNPASMYEFLVKLCTETPPSAHAEFDFKC